MSGVEWSPCEAHHDWREETERERETEERETEERETETEITDQVTEGVQDRGKADCLRWDACNHVCLQHLATVHG